MGQQGRPVSQPAGKTYLYYSLPFCTSKSGRSARAPMGRARRGARGQRPDLVGAALQLQRDRSTTARSARSRSTEETSQQLQYAVRNHYWYQFFLDDLPIWGMVGELAAPEVPEGAPVPAEDAGEPLLYTHKKFVVAYNGNRIIQVNLTSENPVALTAGANIEFSYTVEWSPTDIPFYNRFYRYLDYDFFEHQIHWFSIFNSFMMVIFLTGIVSLILMRTLRKDYAKYARETGDLDDLDQELDESGWKQVHGDVFRPPQLTLFCALVGTGSQLAAMVAIMILFATATTLYMGRGAIIISFLVVYCLTSLIAGYTSGSLYARSGGKFWIQAMLWTAGLFPAICFATRLRPQRRRLGVRLVGDGTDDIRPLVILMWLLVALPLAVVGTILGRNWSGTPNDPCRVNAIPRLIPEKRWFATPPVLIALGGVLPFGSIFIEMYFVFTSFWNYKFYYGTMPIHCLLPTVTCALSSHAAHILPFVSLSLSLYSLRLHVPRLRHPHHRHRLRHDRRHLLPTQQRGLQMAVDLLRRLLLHRRLRPALLDLLLLHEDEDVGLLPDALLLLVHGDLLPRSRRHVRHARVHGMFHLRQKNLPQHQVRLSGSSGRERGRCARG